MFYPLGIATLSILIVPPSFYTRSSYHTVCYDCYSLLQLPPHPWTLPRHRLVLSLHPIFLVTSNRAKSKNSSQHNQVRKAHRNGIKKPKTNKYPSLRGVDPKFVRNQRYAKHGTEKALKAARAEA